MNIRCMFLPTPREILDHLCHNYYMKQYIVACYDMKRKKFNTKYEGLSANNYFGGS